MQQRAYELGSDRESLVREVAPLPLPTSIENLASYYETEALKPLILRRGKYQDLVQTSERWVRSRAQILRTHLPSPSGTSVDDESELRGLLFELISYEAINSMCQAAGVPYRVLYATFELDMSKGESKGGDLLFVKEYSDGSCAPICLIDVKTQVRGKEIGSGMHWGLRRPLPVILIPMNEITWEDEDGERYETHDFMTQKVFRFSEREDSSLLSMLSPNGQQNLFSTLQRRIGIGCDKTQRCIENQLLTDGLERELLIKLGMTQIILGQQ